MKATRKGNCKRNIEMVRDFLIRCMIAFEIMMLTLPAFKTVAYAEPLEKVEQETMANPPVIYIDQPTTPADEVDSVEFVSEPTTPADEVDSVEFVSEPTAPANEVDSVEFVSEPTAPANEVETVNREVSESELMGLEVQTELNELEKKVQGKEPYKTTLNTTAYCPCRKCCGKTDGITASETRAQQFYTVASGKQFPYGTVIHIPSLSNWPNGGWFRVEDRGVKNGCLDIFLNSHSVALDYGRHHREAEVYLP